MIIGYSIKKRINSFFVCSFIIMFTFNFSKRFFCYFYFGNLNEKNNNIRLFSFFRSVFKENKSLILKLELVVGGTVNFHLIILGGLLIYMIHFNIIWIVDFFSISHFDFFVLATCNLVDETIFLLNLIWKEFRNVAKDLMDF